MTEGNTPLIISGLSTLHALQLTALTYPAYHDAYFPLAENPGERATFSAYM
jgi:hypothetical protein